MQNSIANIINNNWAKVNLIRDEDNNWMIQRRLYTTEQQRLKPNLNYFHNNGRHCDSEERTQPSDCVVIGRTVLIVLPEEYDVHVNSMSQTKQQVAQYRGFRNHS